VEGGLYCVAYLTTFNVDEHENSNLNEIFNNASLIRDRPDYATRDAEAEPTLFLSDLADMGVK